MLRSLGEQQRPQGLSIARKIVGALRHAILCSVPAATCQSPAAT
jgi:hypothetical protein